MSDGADRTEDASRILVWGTPRTTGRGGHMTIASIRTQSVSGQNSGIFHGSGPCLRPTEQIVRRSAVTLRRATQTGLRM